MMSYAVIGALAVGVMTTLALTMFKLNMRGDWLTYGGFVVIAMALMLGFGLVIGGIAKNTTQSDMMGQVVFISSMALSGVWIPRAFLPEFLQGITTFLPLTPVIDGIRTITTEGATLAQLGPELGVMAAGALAVYWIGVRTFRWE
jgi:ABC-2 type transport system permease protein